MDRMGYTALTGMRSSLAAQEVTANNLANSSTTGFRRDFAETIAARIEARGSLNSRVVSQQRQNAHDLSDGTVMETGRALDVAISSGSFLTVQDENGAELYSKRGDLSVAPTGLLVNGEGLAVQGTAGPITVPPAAKINIAPDGSVSILAADAQPGDDMETIAQLKLVTPNDPGALKRTPTGLFAATDGALERDPQATVTAGHLEGSNVNTASELVNLLEQARRFELQVGLLTAARDLDQSSAALMRNE